MIIAVEEQTQEAQQELAIKPSKNLKVRILYMILIVLLLSTGFLCWKLLEQNKCKTVYILDEAKFFKLVALGFATENKNNEVNEALQNNLTIAEQEKLKTSMQKFTRILQEEYKRYPILILKRDRAKTDQSIMDNSEFKPKHNPSYELYGEVQKIDITKEVIIKIIGEEKWQEIGKLFLKQKI